MPIKTPTWNETEDVPAWDDTVSPEQEAPQIRIDPIANSVGQIQLEQGRQDPFFAQDREFTTAIAENPLGFVKSIPAIALGAASGIGDVARGSAADLVSEISSDEQYGGNIKSMMSDDEKLPVDRFLGEVSKTNPNLATVGKFGQSMAQTAPLFAVGAAPRWAQKAAAAGFSVHMVSGAGDWGTRFGTVMGKPPEERDSDELTSLVNEGLQIGLFAPLAGKHAARTKKTDVIVALSKQLKNTRFDKSDLPLMEPVSGGDAIRPAGIVDDNTRPTFEPPKDLQVAPLNPGGRVQDLPENLKTIEAENQAKQKEIAAQFKSELAKRAEEKVKGEQPAAPIGEGKDVTSVLLNDLERVPKGGKYGKIASSSPGESISATERAIHARLPDEMPLDFVSNALLFSPKLPRFSIPEHTAFIKLVKRGALAVERVGDNYILKRKPLEPKPTQPAKSGEGVGKTFAEKLRLLRETGFTEENARALMDGSKSPKEVVDSQLGINDSGPDRHREARWLAKTSAINSANEILGRPERFTADELYGKKAQAKEMAEFEEDVLVSNSGDGEKLIGMGAAVPSEFELSPKTPTGIRNAQVDVERQQRGLPPAIQPTRRTFGKVWDEAMAKIDQDPASQDRLIDSLREKPRALTDLEDAMLLHRQIDLQNEFGKATRDLAQAFDDGRLEAVEEGKIRVAELSDKLLDIYDIGKKVGTETGRGLSARRMMANEDFTLASMTTAKRAAMGGKPLTGQQASEIAKLHDKIAATQKAFDEYKSQNESRIAEKEVTDALNRIAKEKPEPTVEPRVKSIAERIVNVLEKEADAARKRLKEKFARTSAGVDPTIIADAAIIGASHIARGALEFSRWSEAMLKDIGEGVKPFLKEIWDASNQSIDARVDRVVKGTDATKVKRAVRKMDLSEKKADAAAKIKEKIQGGERSEITGMVQKLARLFVEQGIKERNALIDAVHDVLKEIDPEFTRRETMDAISGYGDFKQLSKDEISVKLRDLKGQMQQVAKLEDMQAGKPPMKTGLERRIPSPEESRLIKQVNEAKNQFQIPIDDPNTQLKSSLDTLKTRLKNRTTELQDKLARGDFTNKPRRILQMDKEANRLHFEMSKAKAEWYQALMMDRLANRSVPEKILGGVGEVFNTTRAILTSLDLSAVLRQGGFVAFGHPVRALKSFPAMFKALRSEAGQHAVDQQILSRKNYPLYARSKLYLSEHGQKLSQMEEAYMSRWADKIPLVGASQRAYVTFLNKLRADSFDAMANALSRTGELTQKEADAISNYINVATGRGNLGMKENALVGLNTVFFAPRYVASRFQLLAGQPLYHGTARTRTMIAKEYARFLIGVGVVYALGQMAGADVEQDPRSSDFGKLRFGDTRIDPMASLLQNTVLMSRLASGETKTLKGKVVPIRGDKVPFGSGNSADVIARFLRSKLAPVPRTGVDILTGKDVVGNPVTPESVAKGLVVPLAMQDIYDTMREQGVEAGTAMAILSIFGMGLQTYEPRTNATQKP